MKLLKEYKHWLGGFNDDSCGDLSLVGCRDAIASIYKKSNGNMKERINKKGKEIVKALFDSIIDRTDIKAESTCFITVETTKKTF